LVLITGNFSHDAGGYCFFSYINVLPKQGTVDSGNDGAGNNSGHIRTNRVGKNDRMLIRLGNFLLDHFGRSGHTGYAGHPYRGIKFPLGYKIQ